MGQTSPDALPYPSDYNLPADVPNAMQANANAVQTALNKKQAAALATANLTAHGPVFNVASAGPHLVRLGKLVMVRGLFTVTANLTVADNVLYQFATIPGGFRPEAETRMAGTWQCLNTGLTPDAMQIMATQIRALPGGELQFVSNVNGTVRTGGDYVSAGGLTWWTA